MKNAPDPRHDPHAVPLTRFVPFARCALWRRLGAALDSGCPEAICEAARALYAVRPGRCQRAREEFPHGEALIGDPLVAALAERESREIEGARRN